MGILLAEAGFREINTFAAESITLKDHRRVCVTFIMFCLLEELQLSSPKPAYTLVHSPGPPFSRIPNLFLKTPQLTQQNILSPNDSWLSQLRKQGNYPETRARVLRIVRYFFNVLKASLG